MATLDDIAQERQRLTDLLDRLDAERASLVEQLLELDAAARVVARITAPRRGRPRNIFLAEPPAPRLRGRPRKTALQAPPDAPPPLGEATLRAVRALGDAVSAEDVRNYLASEFGMEVRPNHLGMALQRHRRAGRLEQNDSGWSLPEPQEPVGK